MSPVDLVVPVLGVLFVLVVLWVVGTWKNARITSENDVLAAIEHEPVGYRATSVLLGSDGCSALARDDDRFFLVYVFGSRINVRALAPGEIGDASLEPTAEGFELRLRIRDFTRNAFAVRLRPDQHDDARRWLDTMRAGPT